MAKSKRGFSFELRNSKQNTAFCVSKSGEAFSVFASNAVRFRPTRCERYALEATLRRIYFA
ncbi:hypothetical protein OQK14_000179 [Campylobacter upsaliensis]|nr:hypothetical protein [Campylobacter upsaliensis]